MRRSFFAFLIVCWSFPAEFDWGTYDPGTYISVRSRMLNSPEVALDTVTAGVIWGSAHESHFRILDSTYLFSYLYNSPGRFAVQNISDQHLFLNLSTVLQIDQNTQNAWQLQLSGYHAPRTAFTKKEPYASVVFFVALIGERNQYRFVKLENDQWEVRDDLNSTLYTLEVATPAEQVTKNTTYSYYCKEVKNSRGFAWNAEDYAKSSILTDKVLTRDPNAFGLLPNKTLGERCNLLLLLSVPRMNFQFRYRFNDPHLSDLETQKEEFDREMEKRFGPIASENKEFARTVLSNVLGGIGYFTGPIRIAGKGKGAFGKLFTGTPSRITFPRGFLWDEGFHQSIVCRWNEKLCSEVIQSWLDTQDENGWIAREQIRGEESENRVPAAFVQQNETIANPPSLLLPVMYLLRTLDGVPEEKLSAHPTYQALLAMYPKLKKWLGWLYRTQLVDGLPQWAGRSSDHNLASGLDDYPRGQIANGKERHLDLHCWLLFLSKGMSELARLFQLREDAEMFQQDYEKMREKTKEWFFDPSTGLYNDFIGTQYVPKASDQLRFSWRGDNKCGAENLAVNGEPAECNPYGDSPCCSEFGWCGATASHCRCKQCKEALPLEKRADYRAVSLFSPHIGYVTLFPLIHGILDASDPAFASLLAKIRDKEHLWTRFGLRSLSKSSPLYHSGEDYWRGHIWININYLVLRALKTFYWTSPDAQSLYSELRDNVVRTVKGEWESTRGLYEQYSEALVSQMETEEGDAPAPSTDGQLSSCS